MNRYLKHSAKGTEWEDHKYIAKINGRYFYDLNELRSYLRNAGDKAYKVEYLAKEYGGDRLAPGFEFVGDQAYILSNKIRRVQEKNRPKSNPDRPRRINRDTREPGLPMTDAEYRKRAASEIGTGTALPTAKTQKEAEAQIEAKVAKQKAKDRKRINARNKREWAARKIKNSFKSQWAEQEQLLREAPGKYSAATRKALKTASKALDKASKFDADKFKRDVKDKQRDVVEAANKAVNAARNKANMLPSKARDAANRAVAITKNKAKSKANAIKADITSKETKDALDKELREQKRLLKEAPAQYKAVAKKAIKKIDEVLNTSYKKISDSKTLYNIIRLHPLGYALTESFKK